MSSIIGKIYEPFSMAIDKENLAAFAEAIGETNPVYFDEAAAKQSGYKNIIAAPTYPFTVAMKANQPFMVLEDMGIDKTRSVHGEQAFTYYAPIFAGDVITGRQRIADIYEKKGGALQFIVTETDLSNQEGTTVCSMKTVIVVRN